MIAEAAAEMIRQLEQTRLAERRSLAGPGTTNQASAFWRALYPVSGSSGPELEDTAIDTESSAPQAGYHARRRTQPVLELDPLTSVVHAPPAQETPQQQQTKQFFEVCLTSGKHVVRLHEIDLDGVKFDGDLFQRIREQYRRAKRFYSIRKMFLTPKDVHFVMFSVTRAYNNLAGIHIHAKPSEYPPQEELDKGRYHYRRPKILMPAHVFLHFLRTPRGLSGCSHRHDTWLQRLPKKLNASVLEEVQQLEGNGRFVTNTPSTQQENRDQEDIVFGWGVHIIDGPNHLCLSLLLVLGIFVTSILSVTVAVVAGTEEQAFGIGQYLIAILTCGLTAAFLVLDNW